MTNYLLDGIYDRALVGTGENLPTVANPDGSVVFQYRYVFSGETLLEQSTGNPIPTYNFAGLAFATPSGAPYDTVARITESKNDVGGNRVYLNHLVDMTYMSNGAVYYHQQYSWAGTGQGYIASETVSGSLFDQSFYKSRVDYFDPGVHLTSQLYLDGAGVTVMKSDYVFSAAGPWAKLESDYVPDGSSYAPLAHQIYSAADGSTYVDSVYRTINGFNNVYSTGAGVSADGWAARIDQYGYPNHLVQQQFLDSGNAVALTIDYTYSGLFSSTKVSSGSSLDDDPYSRITDFYNLNGPGVTKRVYDMRDGSHTVEVLMAQQWLMGTELGSGVTNADDTYKLFGQDLVYFQGRFGHDTLYGFNWQPTTGLSARLDFEHTQFADLAAVRAAATITDNGHDITITNSFGDTVVLKEVIHDAVTINDVLNANSVLFF